jgi:hydrocephalus-inducing protein
MCNIRFEPSNLGDSRALLTLTSADAGEYTCVLNGHSTPPKPQGPIKIGKGFNIEFKNPFNEALEFTIRFDNPAFLCTNKSPIRVDAKKATSI